MYTFMVVVRKKKDVSIEEFRRVWKEEYGPMYQQIPQVKSYQQFHLTDRRKDDAEDPIDGIAMLSFDSKEDMKLAWETETYKAASLIREGIMRETSVGVHVAEVDDIVNIIG